MISPLNNYEEPQQAFFFGFSGTASVTFIEVPVAGAATASSEARVFFDTMWYISVNIRWKACSTFVASRAEVSINESPSFSQNAFPSSVWTALKWRRSLLFPTSIMTILLSAWSRNSLSHLSTFSNVTETQKTINFWEENWRETRKTLFRQTATAISYLALWYRTRAMLLQRLDNTRLWSHDNALGQQCPKSELWSSSHRPANIMCKTRFIRFVTFNAVLCCLKVTKMKAIGVLTWMLRVANSTPMVDLLSRENSLRVKRLSKFDFPTPESPMRTTLKR